MQAAFAAQAAAPASAGRGHRDEFWCARCCCETACGAEAGGALLTAGLTGASQRGFEVYIV